MFLRKRSDAVLAPVGMAQGGFHVIPSDATAGDALLRDFRGLEFAHKTSRAIAGGVEFWNSAELRKLIRK